MTEEHYNKIQWVMTTHEDTGSALVTHYVSVGTLPLFDKLVIQPKKAIAPHLEFRNGRRKFATKRMFIESNVVAFVETKKKKQSGETNADEHQES